MWTCLHDSKGQPDLFFSLYYFYMFCRSMSRLCLIAIVLFSISTECAGKTHPVQYLGIENGLSNNAVTSIYQDHNGFMWFGTYDGLNRFDGYSFKVFRNVIKDSNSLLDNHIYSMDGDASHNLWIGCSKGISIYDPLTHDFSSARFRNRQTSAIQEFTAGTGIIRVVNNGTLVLAGTQSKGLIVFSSKDQPGEQIPLPSQEDRKNDYTVSAIEYDLPRQIIWIFIQQKGLYRFNIRTRQLEAVNAALTDGDCLKADQDGNIWLGNDLGLFKYNRVSNSFSGNLMSSGTRIAALTQDKQKNLWIGSDGGGVWYLPAKTERPVPYLSSSGTALINSNAVYALYEDNDERKWIGTLRGGINVIHSRSTYFRNISFPSSWHNGIAANNFILSFCEDEKNNIWIGTDGAGLRYWNRTTNSFSHYINTPADKTSVSSNFVTNILCDSEKDIWVTTWFGGLNKFNKATRAFQRYSCFNPRTGVEENNAWAIYEDRARTIWVSTSNNGTLYTLNRKTRRFELFDENIVNVQCLSEDSQGNFWAGNYTSLLKIDRTGKKHQVFKLGYPVRSIHEDQHKNFWVGTEGGGLLLFNRDDGSYTRFTTSDGLPSNSIMRMLEDKQGNLWFSTYNGLCKFNTTSRVCRNFSQSDGLQSNQFSFNAGLALRSGEFMFGGIKGFNIFYPDSIYDRKETPRLFLTDMRISNTPVSETQSYITKRELEKIQQVTLPFDRAILSLDFTALEFTGADKIKYAYMLEGWDKDWNYVSNNRTANYSRLQEGNYTFKVKVTNSDGVWSEETSLLQIIVSPPWYRSWWAYVCYAFAFLSAVYVYVLYNKRRERMRYKIKLAQLEKEKERELTEKKISFFTHIAHEFRTPLTLIINPLKELVRNSDEHSRSDLSMIFRNSRRLLSLVDQLLLFRKVESAEQQMNITRFDILGVCQEVYLSFSQHALAKTIDFSFHPNGHEIPVYADKENIEIILFNLVSNAFKYTPAGGRIKMEVMETDGNIEILVRDSGIGIPEGIGCRLFESFYQAGNRNKVSQSGFGVGLYVSKKLALAHQGNLSYTSQEGIGTEFRLSLLKGKDQFIVQQITEDEKNGQTILQELVDEPETEINAGQNQIMQNESVVIDKLMSSLPTMVIVDDNADIRSYIRKIFCSSFHIYEADDGSPGYELIIKEHPDIVISDIMMKDVGGIELCQKIKNNPAIAHTPVILLTGSFSDETKLQGIEGGAEDYITKPFDSTIIIARVKNILNGRNRLQQYFFNAVTLKPYASAAGEHKEFIERCILIVEQHLQDPGFTITDFCKEIGMSHPSLYKKVKAVSGLTVNVFIRYLRLRKAAELLINTDKTIVEVTYITGFNDIRYFREQFHKLFEMNPSEYVKRYRRVLGKKLPDTAGAP
jgi:signal transduction histidine kinase/ligand-binding sensor domain-containing protein/DNA-binding response OmpR family regulator